MFIIPERFKQKERRKLFSITFSFTKVDDTLKRSDMNTSMKLIKTFVSTMGFAILAVVKIRKSPQLNNFI